eukprot:TRINITY_DN2682_c0_g2_i1.p1 TRINITY_DN2682_c0_g2~~TRINITY_DN2682_c0_g2_i1.p1  ORF type:complete len:713 (+),score=147.96 TRINITY_DN2682_c0_g2_i1:320-2140(+)
MADCDEFVVQAEPFSAFGAPVTPPCSPMPPAKLTPSGVSLPNLAWQSSPIGRGGDSSSEDARTPLKAAATPAESPRLQATPLSKSADCAQVAASPAHTMSSTPGHSASWLSLAGDDSFTVASPAACSTPLATPEAARQRSSTLTFCVTPAVFRLADEPIQVAPATLTAAATTPVASRKRLNLLPSSPHLSDEEDYDDEDDDDAGPAVVSIVSGQGGESGCGGTSGNSPQASHRLSTGSHADESASPKSENSESDTDSETTPKRKRRRGGPYPNPAGFACQQSPGGHANHNTEITAALDALAEMNKNTGNRWRNLAYTKAANAIRNYPKQITSVEEVRRIPCVGGRIAEKVKEIIETGHLRRLEEIAKNPQETTVNLFSQIFGAGPDTCLRWYAQGFRTLEDLRTKATLTKPQAIGLKYLEEFKQRIPRLEVARIEAVVHDALHTLDPSLTMVTCGSYRRGVETCGDVDILLTGPGDTTHVISRLVGGVLRCFFTDDLTHVGESCDKYMGVCRLPGGLHRRIDLKAFRAEEWACALLYFTGSGHFNRSMRLFARKKGYSLSEHALVRRWGRPSSAEEFKGEPIPVATEKDVFRVLGLEFKTPEERNV